MEKNIPVSNEIKKDDEPLEEVNTTVKENLPTLKKRKKDGETNITPEETVSVPKKHKKKEASGETRRCVTSAQRELIVSFMGNNPELITHSSTQESEKVLWEEMTSQLNLCGPAKSLKFWKSFWVRWMKSLEQKPESSLTLIEFRLKKFLLRVGTNIDTLNKSSVKNDQLSIEEIGEKISDIEAEKVKILLEIDEFDYKILYFKRQIQELKNNIIEKRKKIMDINKTKFILHKKKAKFLREE